MPFPADEHLDPKSDSLRIRRVLRAVRGPQAQLTCSVSDGEALLIWLDSWLKSRNALSPEQRDLVLDEFGCAIVACGEEIARAFSGITRVPAYALQIVDSTYIGLNRPGDDVVDLRTAQRLHDVPRPPLERHIFELPELYHRHVERLRLREPNDDRDTAESSRTPDGPVAPT